MNNNDVLRRLRYALNITDLKVIELFALAGRELGRPELEALFRREEEPGYLECPDELAEAFLEGLVISKRGPREVATGAGPGAAATASGAATGVGPGKPGPGPAAPAPRRRGRLTNNDILKSIRIALELRDEDIIAIMALAGVQVARSEASALFRKPGHVNFRPCGDQFLRNFLVGLTAKYRV